MVFLAFSVVSSGCRSTSDEEAEEKKSVTAAGKPAEGPVEPFLDEPRFDTQQLFEGGRFPNVVVAVDGTVLATWGKEQLRVRRSEDGGDSWGAATELAGGVQHGGGVTVDETTGHIFAFAESEHPPAPVVVYRSTDQGKTWSEYDTTLRPNDRGHAPSMHMAEHGITLRHGDHRGRLLRPARYFGEGNSESDYPDHYNTAIYSDDGGATWHASDPFPEFGTGEGAVVELSDGTIYYNSRRHWAPEGTNPRRRWEAWSYDGGKTWEDASLNEVLPDGAQHRDYGCMGGLVRLPVEGRDILVFSNIVSEGGRQNGHVWISFDGGTTWPLKKQIDDGAFAYSSVAAGRPGTPSAGMIYLMYEMYGEGEGGAEMARFNLAWLLDGTKTGDGDVPDWVTEGTGTTEE